MIAATDHRPSPPPRPEGVCSATWEAVLSHIAAAPAGDYVAWLYLWARVCRRWRSIARTDSRCDELRKYRDACAEGRR